MLNFAILAVTAFYASVISLFYYLFFLYYFFEKFWNNQKNLQLLILKFVNTRNFSLASLATFYFLSWDIFKKQFF